MSKESLLISVTSKDVRISPNKLNVIASKIRGKSYKEALLVFQKINQKAGVIILQTLMSAATNAINVYNMNREQLIIREIFVNQGKIFKRMQPRAKGKAYEIQKKTAHITLWLGITNSN